MTAAEKADLKVAVLGGGLTGLTTALFLATHAPKASIVLYEGSHRLGGWAHTAKMHVENEAGLPHTVAFERGPRVIRLNEADPNAHLYILFLEILGITKDAWALGPNSDLSKRYIYHPDHLVDLSGPLQTSSSIDKTWQWLKLAGRMLGNCLREPAFKSLLPSVAHILFHRESLSAREYCLKFATVPDETIGACLTRLCGGRREVADNLASAMAHGVYGGDIWRLSAQSTMFAKAQMFPYKMQPPSGYAGAAAKIRLERLSDLLLMRTVYDPDSELNEVIEETAREFLGGWTGFYAGFEALTDRIAEKLRRLPNVTIRTGVPVTRLAQPVDNQIEVTAGDSSENYDKVVSTLFSGQLASITGGLLPALSDTKGVTMHCVNIWFPKSGLKKSPRGFGYLISSQATVEPGLLGVMFDSDREQAIAEDWDRRTAMATGGKDAAAASRLLDHSGTKFTVLVRAAPSSSSSQQHPPRTTQKSQAIALAHVRRQFSIADDEPVHAQVNVMRDCIPQHEVGHQDRMAAAHAQLASAFAGRLAVAGPSYTPPGVLPAIRAAHDMAASVAGREVAHVVASLRSRPDEGSRPIRTLNVGSTGLGRFADGRRSLWNDLVIVDEVRKWRFVYGADDSADVVSPQLEYGTLPPRHR